MTTAVVFVVLGLPVMLVALMAVLTGVGQYRRTGHWASAVLAVSCFPLVWVAWYARDDLGRTSR